MLLAFARMAATQAEPEDVVDCCKTVLLPLAKVFVERYQSLEAPYEAYVVPRALIHFPACPLTSGPIGSTCARHPLRFDPP